MICTARSEAQPPLPVSSWDGVCPLRVPAQVAAQGLHILMRDRLQQELLGTPSFSAQRGMTTGSWEKLTWTCAAIHILPLQPTSISSAQAGTQ